MRTSHVENNFTVVSFWITVVIGLIAGIFFNIYYGIVAWVVLGLILGLFLDNTKLSDRIGIGITAFIMFVILYGLAIVFISINIDSKIIVKNEIEYDIRLLENKTIVFETENSIDTIENAELYYKCKLEQCSSLVKIEYIHEPANTMLAKNMFPRQYIKYDVK